MSCRDTATRRGYKNNRDVRLAEFFLEAARRNFSLLFFAPRFPFFLFYGAMSNERTLPRRRAAASVVSYTREGAKKWSDQCQISAFTASVCDPQRRRRARVRPGAKARSQRPWITYLPTRIRGQKRAPLARYRMLIIRRRCQAISLCNEQKMGITKPVCFVKRGGNLDRTLSWKRANGHTESLSAKG